MIVLFAGGAGWSHPTASNIDARLAQLIIDLAGNPPRPRPRKVPPRPRQLGAGLLHMEMACADLERERAATPHAQLEDLWARNYGVAP